MPARGHLAASRDVIAFDNLGAEARMPVKLSSRGPQPFWHQGQVSWKIVLPWTKGEGTVTFIVHFINITSLPFQIIRH